MKKTDMIRKAVTALFIAAFAMTGCINEDIRYEREPDKSEDIGYLSLAGLDVEVLSDTEIIAGLGGKSVTRAGVVSPDDFDVKIIDAEGNTVQSFRYADRPTESIELEVGKYTLRISSGEVPELAWESPVYGAAKEFFITRQKETALGRIICRLSSIKVSVEYSADLPEQLSPDTKVNVRLGGTDADFGFDEKRAVYFRAPSETNEMELTITGRYADSAPEDEGFEMTSKLTNVKAGQWRKITVIIEHANEGDIHIRVECENWVFDEVITVETSSMLAEKAIEEEPEEGLGRPEIIWQDNDISAPFTLTEDMFDIYGDYMEPFRINVKTPNRLAALTVDISSTSGDFLSSLGGYGIPALLDMCAPGSSAAILTAMGYTVGDRLLGQQSTMFNLQGQMKLLFAYGGKHEFRITATDELGLKTAETLVLNVGGTGPDIEWIGHDIDAERCTIYDELDVTIKITSEAGIRDFVVTIDSDTLTPSELESVGLQADIDLINPGDMSGALTEFGFPLGDQVLGKNELELSITNFMSLLMVTGKGDHDFIFKITDNNGGTTVKTLKLKTE